MTIGASFVLCLVVASPAWVDRDPSAPLLHVQAMQLATVGEEQQLPERAIDDRVVHASYNALGAGAVRSISSARSWYERRRA